MYKNVVLIFIIFAFYTSVNAGVYPKPNYNSQSEYNIEYLYDKKITRSANIWNKGRALEWRNRSTVIIPIPYKYENDAVIKVHTAKKESSGILPPKFIMLYCANEEEFNHLTSMPVDADVISNNSEGWIVVENVPECLNELFLVVHSRGSFLMIDEVDIQADKKKRKVGIPSSQYSDLLMHDSRLKIKEHYSKTNFDLFENQNKVGVSFSYSQLGNLSLQDVIAGLSNDSIMWHDNFNLYFYIALHNTKKDQENYQILFQGAEIVSVDIIEKVMASNGLEVFDLVKPTTLQSIDGNISPNEIKVFGVSLRVIHEDVSVTYNTETVEESNRVSVMPLPNVKDVQAFNLQAGGWAYMSKDKVIFSDDLVSEVSRQVESGIDLFFIHSSEIYKPFDSSKQRRREEFKDLVKSYESVSEIILFLNWNKKWRSVSDRDLSEWLANIKEDMLVMGRSTDHWFLYPFDEINKKKYKKSLSVYKKFKALDPDIKIYANPSAKREKEMLGLGELAEFKKYIDFFQPRRGENYNRVKQALAKSERHHLGFYDNFDQPVKSVPAICYREMAWSAYSLGAESIATWSLSSVEGRSAIDDFDGNGPDWSFLYEGEGGYLPSVRFLEFQFGLKDYQYLKQCSLNSCKGFEAYIQKMEKEFSLRCGV